MPPTHRSLTNTIVERASERGVPITTHQLKRWRHEKVIPSWPRNGQPAGGRTAESDDSIIEYVVEFAKHNQPPRPLFLIPAAMFIDGYDVPDECLRVSYHRFFEELIALVRPGGAGDAGDGWGLSPHFEHAEVIVQRARHRSEESTATWRRRIRKAFDDAPGYFASPPGSDYTSTSGQLEFAAIHGLVLTVLDPAAVLDETQIGLITHLLISQLRPTGLLDAFTNEEIDAVAFDLVSLVLAELNIDEMQRVIAEVPNDMLRWGVAESRQITSRMDVENDIGNPYEDLVPLILLPAFFLYKRVEFRLTTGTDIVDWNQIRQIESTDGTRE